MSVLLSSANSGFAGVWAAVSSYETKDWLGISGFFIAVWNLLYARRKDRREPLRADICKSVDRVQRVAEARTALITHLDSVRAGCFTGRLKYWKTKGDFAGDEEKLP